MAVFVSKRTTSRDDTEIEAAVRISFPRHEVEPKKLVTRAPQKRKQLGDQRFLVREQVLRSFVRYGDEVSVIKLASRRRRNR